MTSVHAAPISNGERLRFSRELQKSVPALRKSEINQVGISFSPDQLDAIMKKLAQLGWSRQSRSFVGYELNRKDWTWPIFIDTKQNLIYLGPDDGALSAKDVIAKAAKAILPGGFGVFDSYAVFKSSTSKPEVLDQILTKAKRFGFRHTNGEWRTKNLTLQFNSDSPQLTVYILFDAQRGL